MTQHLLFDTELPTGPAKVEARSRRTDPSTSKTAAAKYDDTGKTASDSARITAYVHIHRDGVTAAEIANGLDWINGTKVDNVRVSRRIADLITIGEVKYRLESRTPDVYESRTCRIKGRAMLTIWPAY